VLEKVSSNNNNFLGNIVNFLINDFYKNEQSYVKTPSVNEYLGLTLSIIGYDFSGKETIANFLKQKYGLEVLKMENVIQECFERV
jgi:hypothetical protein